MEFENGVSFYRGILCDTKRVGPLSQSSLEYHVSVEQTGSSVEQTGSSVIVFTRQKYYQRTSGVNAQETRHVGNICLFCESVQLE